MKGQPQKALGENAKERILLDSEFMTTIAFLHLPIQLFKHLSAPTLNGSNLRWV